VIFLLIQTNNVSAQGVCCVSDSGCNPVYYDENNNFVTMTQDYCLDPNKVPQTPDDPAEWHGDESCTQLAVPGGVCEEVCCCIKIGANFKGSDQLPMLKSQCTTDLYISTTNSQANCNTMCNSNYVSVTGDVFKSDGTTLAPALLLFKTTFEDSGVTVNKEFTTTSTSGHYELSVLNQKNYDIEVADPYGDSSCLITKNDFVVQDSDINNKDFTLACEPGTGENCVFSYTYNFEDGKSCGEIKSITINNNCNGEYGLDDVPLSVGQILECPPGGEITCNNNDHIDLPEEDCDRPNAFPVGTDKDCTIYNPSGGYLGGEIICTPTCKISEENCLTCPDNPDDCTGDMCEFTNCLTCQGADICQEEVCDATSDVGLTLVPLDPIEGVGFNILPTWTPTNHCEVDSYKLERCKGEETLTSCDGESTIIAPNLGGNLVSYKDIIEAGEDYYKKAVCYTITPTMKDGSSKSPFTKCKLVAGGDCSTRQAGDEFCGYNKERPDADGNKEYVGECGADNIEIPIKDAAYCSESQTCIEIGNAKAICEDAEEICEYCNGPLNMFGYLDVRLSQEYIDQLEAIPQAPDFSHPNNPECGDVESKYALCYLDDFSNTFTSVGLYSACSKIASCYDYKTQASCLAHSCKNPDASDCYWEPYTEDNELGIGVCRPTDAALQDCTQCNDNSPIGYCPEDMCKLYGTEIEQGVQRCYYNEKNLKNYDVDSTLGCLNSENVGCETYDTKKDCVMATGNTPKNVLVNLGEGKNSVIPSDDLLKKGKCYWDDTTNACYKDADKIKTEDEPSDCEGDNDAQICQTDMIPPETTIMSIEEDGVYSKEEVKNLKFQVEDNQYSGDKLSTLFSLSQYKNSYLYPDKTKEELTNFINEISLSEVNPNYKGGEPIPASEKNYFTKDYTLNYFSKDVSKNLEEVQSIGFTMIPPLEAIVDTDITYVYLGSYGGPDEYEANLTVSVSYFEPYPGYDVICESVVKKIQNVEGSPLNNFKGKLKGPDNIFWEYNYIEDAQYELNVTCKDNHDQVSEVIKTIIINSNPTISEPTPPTDMEFITYRLGDDVDISITTEKESACQYLYEAESSDWQDYDTTDGFKHTKTVQAQVKGINLIHSRCVSGGKSFTGNEADDIFFAVDEEHPEIKIVDESTQSTYDPIGPRVDELQLKFECTDPQVPYFNREDLDFSFGCDEFKFCEFVTGTTPCTDFDITPDKDDSSGSVYWTYKLLSPNPNEFKSINYYVSDKGGNSFTKAIPFPTLKDTVFQKPDVIICDPDAAIPCEAVGE